MATNAKRWIRTDDGASSGHLVGDLVVERSPRDRADAAIPLLAGARVRGTLLERPPWWRDNLLFGSASGGYVSLTLLDDGRHELNVLVVHPANSCPHASSTLPV
jgi:hypothetical protein